MPVVKYSGGSYLELNGDLNCKRLNSRNDIFEHDDYMNSQNKQEITRNFFMESRNSAVNSNDINNEHRYRTERASSVTYSHGAARCTQEPPSNFLAVFSPSTNSSSSGSNNCSLTSVTSTYSGYNNSTVDSSSQVNVRRHSSASCCVTESTTPPPPPPPSKQDNVPPPLPLRLTKPPAIPTRKRITNVRPNDESIKKKLEQLNNINKSGNDQTISSELVNNNNMIKIPPPPQTSNFKRSVSGHKRNSTSIANTSNDIGELAIIKTSSGNEPEDSASSYYKIRSQNIKQNNQKDDDDEKEEEVYFKFPRVASAEKNRAFNEEGGLSLVRKKSGKKVPPPLQTSAASYEEDSGKMVNVPVAPMRHDSTLSCSDGGISQNSSPSYIVRSLDSPLLPTNRQTKRKLFTTNRLFAGTSEFRSTGKDSDCSTSTPDLTKNQAATCELQTVVNFQHPSSGLPYQHKVNTVTQKASLTGSQLKFQFAQIIINVLVLIAVAGGLACYFRAYPTTITTVKYINNTTTYRPTDYNMYYPDYYFMNYPNGFVCSPFMAPFCYRHGVPYNISVFPNFVNSMTQRDAEAELEAYEAIANVRCYQLAPLFFCTILQPKCGLNGFPVQPCRTLCEEMYSRCGIFLEVLGLKTRLQIDCATLPMSNNADECVGSKEMRQHEEQERIIVCSDGFKCDERRCIPSDWRCDGHIDCEDEADELNCTQCPGQLHCGNGKCIATSHICDGTLDCPWGQDERNCIRLSERMGNVGSGEVEIFVASEKSFKPACVTSWNPKHSPRLLCNLLGYEHVNNTELSNSTNKGIINTRQNPANMNKISLFQQLKKCNNTEHSFPLLRASCKSYVCGVRKRPFGAGMVRVIGGKKSNPGDWPFLAAILGGPKEIFYCAGVLISDQWILTAAHCVGNFNASQLPKDWTVQLGMTRRFSHSYFGQKIKVRKVIPHPYYNSGVVHDNDIALFQLQNRVKFHDHLLPVCMPSRRVKLVPPKNCTVIGWGKRNDSRTMDYEPTVNEVEVPLLNHSLCKKWLKNEHVNVTPQMVCAGYEEGGKDACQGDSGGPLLCQVEDNPNKWFVGGIVSWGVNCAQSHSPGVYANVPQFVGWIDDQIKQYSY